MKNVLNQWNNAAQKYTEEQEKSEYAESNKRVVAKRFPQLNGERVLDLGCGYGFYTNYFKEIGANVIGVDGSEAMIKLAQQAYSNCDYLLADITQPLDFADETFDIIFCNQVLMDIENIEGVFSECRRLLKNNGIFYYSIVHPAFYDCHWIKDEKGYRYAKSIEKYIEPYKFLNEFWGETTHFHRSLSYYLNIAANNGFLLVNTEEPISYDGKTKNKDLPLFFIAEYKKLNI